MIEDLIDTNIFSEIFKGNVRVKQYVESLTAGVDTTIYVECLQGQKSNSEKQKSKNIWLIYRFCISHRKLRSEQSS